MSRGKAAIWARASRLQMQPLMALPVLLGGLLAWRAEGVFSLGRYLLGQCIVALLLLAITYANDYADYETDRINRTYARFSGGSRVLVEGLIERGAVLRAAWLALAGAGILSLVLVTAYDVGGLVPMMILLGTIAGIEYSLPPLRLIHRGLGELTVALANSFLPLLYGYHLQAGPGFNRLPWLLSMPLAFIVLGGITLSQFPDYPSDKVSGKGTLVVRFGKRRMFGASALGISLGYLILLGYLALGVIDALIVVLILLSAPVVGWLLYLLLRAKGDEEGRLELMGGLAISLTVWFCLASIVAVVFLKMRG